MKKFLALSLILVVVLAMGVGVASAKPGGQQAPLTQDQEFHVTEGDSIQDAIDEAPDGGNHLCA